MKITEKVLKDFSFFAKAKGEWQHNSRGFIFRLKLTDTKNIHGDHLWEFRSTPQESPFHYVDSLEELLGFIADDHYQAGKEQMQADIREALGIHEDAEKRLRVREP